MRGFLTTFRNNSSGATAILFGLMVPVLCLTIGGAVDFLRRSHAQSNTSSALDSAVLAGATALWRGGTETEALAAAQQHYNTNVVQRFDVTNDTVTFSVVDDGTAVSATGNAEIRTSFLKLAGIDTMPIFSDPKAALPKAKVTAGGGDIEVALMLDVTGSMCDDCQGPCAGGTKLDALKSAAKDLINFVVRNDQSKVSSRVALVPFSKRIRIAPDGQGGGVMKAMTNLDPTWSGYYNRCVASVASNSGTGTEFADAWECTQKESQYVSNWRVIPCVTDRFYDSNWNIDATDDAPGFGRWLNANGGRRQPLSQDSAETPPLDELGLDILDPADHYNWNENGSCTVDEANQIVPLSDDKRKLKDSIDGLVAEKATGGALGTAFSWYMLSPKWSGLWSSDGAAGSYTDLTTIQSNGAPKLRKVAVLMSDGVYNTYRGWDDKDQQESSDYAIQLCTAMKTAGIEIYTVGFDLDALPSNERSIAEATLQSCGTDIDHFYNTLDPNELKDAFRDIATKLGSVSLVR